MGRFDGVLLTSDFDNTLIYTEDALRTGGTVPSLSEENRAALEYFMAEGGKFAIATGRALAAFMKYADQVPMNAPAVVCNGAALYDFSAEEYLETAMMEGEVRERGQAVLDAFPQVAVEAYHVDNVIHAVHPNEITRHHEHLTKVGVVEKESLLDVPLPLGKLLFEADRSVLEEVKKFLEERGWAEEYELIFSGQSLMEMTARGANKGGMVRRLAERLNVPLEHLYCVGDEANDIPMLTLAAQGFAPANCVPAVRACGAAIVSDARDSALADVVEQLKSKYPEKK